MPRYDRFGNIERPSGLFGDAHPILVIGIIIFICTYVPFFNLPKWIGWIGISVILLGGVLSIFNVGDRYL